MSYVDINVDKCETKTLASIKIQISAMTGAFIFGLLSINYRFNVDLA